MGIQVMLQDKDNDFVSVALFHVTHINCVEQIPMQEC